MQEQDDDPLVTDPVIHRTVQADKAEPIRVAGPSSIFSWDGCSIMRPTRQRKDEAALIRVVRHEDGVRCERILPQETDEWKEREQARRARQVIPSARRKLDNKG